MYLGHFGLTEAPFSIAPNPRYLYMDHQYLEALAHLMFGLNSGGGVILLTGEVGTGKTTISRKLLEKLPDNIDVAWIINPKLSAEELLAAICDELGIAYPQDQPSIKVFTDRISNYLIDAHAAGRNVLLIIDEAQNLSPTVLEQLRLLTNLETNERKLLQIALLGQPELQTMLERNDLRQLAQRITSRYHLQTLSLRATTAYIQHRLGVAGCKQRIFSTTAIKQVYRLSHGTPRLINLLCDRAMLGAYSCSEQTIHTRHIKQASREVLGAQWRPQRRYLPAMAAAGVIFAIGLWGSTQYRGSSARVQHSVSAEQRNPALHSPVPAIIPTIAAAPSPINPQAAEQQTSGQLASKEQDSKPDTPWQIIEQNGSKARAFQTLAAIWHTQTEPQSSDPCESLQDKTLACLDQRAHGWLLRTFNRPAIFSIRDRQQQEHFAVIRSANSSHAVIQLGTQQWTVPWKELKRRWQQRIMLIWPKPPGAKLRLHPGDRGQAVTWLAHQLDHFQGTMIPPRTFTRMDAILIERLKDFQRQQGLPADGNAGPLTFNRIQELLHPELPSLREQQHGIH